MGKNYAAGGHTCSNRAASGDLRTRLCANHVFFRWLLLPISPQMSAAPTEASVNF